MKGNNVRMDIHFCIVVFKNEDTKTRWIQDSDGLFKPNILLDLMILFSAFQVLPNNPNLLSLFLQPQVLSYHGKNLSPEIMRIDLC